MRRFGRRRFGGRRRASVAWIPGFSGYDTAVPTNQRTITLASQGAVAPNTWAVPVALVTPTDLSLHGGEDAVLTRIRGRFMLLNGRVDSGAGFAAATFPVRVVIALAQSDASGVFSLDYTTAAGLGRDEIIHETEAMVSQAVLTDSTPSAALGWNWIEIDSKAKRRMQESALAVMWFQTVLPVGTIAADFRYIGGLRTLLKRPR